MATMNISLLPEQLRYVDELVGHYGFANRSEFFRSVIRLLKAKPNLVADSSTLPFIPPTEKSVQKIMTGFKKEKKYSAQFLKDLEVGLKESNYFNE
jgi:metal-responsive CopG/Arc/MetJ family transcriptional regulator